MIGKTAKIPLKQIERVEIYVNSGKRSLKQIKKETGADYILNAGLFHMTTFKPVNGLTVAGRVLSTGDNFGYAFKGANIALSYNNDANWPYYIGAYPCLIRNGKKDFSKTPSGLGGDRGRSAIGLAKDSLVLRCVPDVSGASDFTLDELAADLLTVGCTSAINLDGGGASQCDFAGETITSSRRVHNFICVWMKAGQTPEKGNHMSYKICIDPGHGGTDPGACTGGVQEKDLTLAIGRKLISALERCGIEVIPTRTTDKSLSLTERCTISNNARVDGFISVHINSASSTAATGIETWHSQGSAKGQKLAGAIQSKVIAATGAVNRGIKATTEFTVVRKNTAPACLIECGFIVNDGDRAKLLQDGYQDKIAEAITRGVCEWFGVIYKDAEKTQPIRHWAENALDSLAAKGIISEPDKHRADLDGSFTKGELCVMLDKILI